jgi:beta-galactosidase
MDSDDGVRFTRNNDRKYMNDKGLVTRDRKTRKDVFYLYKSLWNNSETTVCITSKRLRYYPAGEPLRIKVYSNAKSLTLYQNDKEVGKLTRPDDSLGVVWTFPSLYLDTYQDTFKVVADDGTSDSVTYYRK